MGAKPNISQEMRQNIADDLAVGCSYGEIATRYGVSFSTIRRIKNNSPEAPTAMENASEDNTDSEPLADTNIITDVPENVKQDDYSPYESAVDDAVLERIERLRNKIADLQLEMSNYESEISRLEEYHLKYMEAQNNERSNENC